MLQTRYDGLHVRAHLLRVPLLACHTRHTEIDQLLLAGVGERAAGVAPLAVILVEGAVRLPAGCGVVERHSAALRRAKQGVDRNIKKAGKQLQGFHIGRGVAVFPAGDGLPRDKELFGQLVLRQSLFRCDFRKFMV